MICKNCGFRVDNPDTLYCPNCNSYLKEVENNNNTFFSPEYTPETVNNTYIPQQNSIVPQSVQRAINQEEKGFIGIQKEQNGSNNNDDLIEIKREPVKFSATKIVTIIVIIIWVVAICIFVKGMNGKSFYIEKDQPTSNVATEEVLKENDKEYKAKSKSGQEGTVSGDGVTSVIFDNQYLKQTILKQRSDLDKFILEDSNNNRKNCSQKILDIEKNIENNYGIIAVNLCELDVDFAKELESVAKYIYDKYPGARGRITNLTLANVDKNANYMASFMPMFTFITSKTSTTYPVGIKTMILLNAKYFLNPSRLNSSVKYGANSGYFPKNATRSSAVAHEFGHYLSYVAMLNYYEEKDLNFVRVNQSSTLNDVYEDFKVGTFSDKLVKKAYERYLNNYNGTKNYYEFRASISLYAVAKDGNGNYIYDETIAEAFHDVYLNGNKAAQASLLIVEALNEYL